MVSKESKLRILENFYALDYALLGENIKNVKVCCPVFIEEYMTAKGALMSLVHEIYKAVNHTPPVIKEKATPEYIMECAVHTGQVARQNAASILKTEDCKAEIAEALRESVAVSNENKSDLQTVLAENIRKRALTFAIDNMLLGRAVSESTNFEQLAESWGGKVLEDSYVVLRDNLVESALDIITNKDPV